MPTNTDPKFCRMHGGFFGISCPTCSEIHRAPLLDENVTLRVRIVELEAELSAQRQRAKDLYEGSLRRAERIAELEKALKIAADEIQFSAGQFRVMGNVVSSDVMFKMQGALRTILGSKELTD